MSLSLYLYLIFFIWVIYLILVTKAVYKEKTITLCLLIGSILLAGYLINMQKWSQTVYGGLVGDNSFQVAFLNNVIHENRFFFLSWCFLLSAPFWGLVLYSFLNLPHGPNYRTHYIALWHFDPVGYTFGLGYGGGLFLFGLLAIRRLWKQGIKSPGYLLLSVYGLVGINFLTYPLLGLSWLPAKWMEFLLVFFAGLAGKGLKEFVDKKLYFRRNLLMIVLSASLLPTPLIWNVFTDFNFYSE